MTEDQTNMTCREWKKMGCKERILSYLASLAVKTETSQSSYSEYRCAREISEKIGYSIPSTSRTLAELFYQGRLRRYKMISIYGNRCYHYQSLRRRSS